MRQWLSSLFRSAPKRVQASFDIAQTTAENRKHWAHADGLSARAALSPAVRRVVRLRSRYESENNSWYRGILRTAVNHIVGTGPRLQVLSGNRDVDLRIEAAWRRWTKASGLMRALRTMVDAYWRDGEVFVMRSERPRLSPIPLDLRIYEADQIASPWNVSHNSEFVDDGIRFDASLNEFEIHVLDHHPGQGMGNMTHSGRWYSAQDVLHLFRRERPGQTRGLPRATSALQTLPIMRRQELATLFSAETAANFALYLKTNSPALDPAASPADFAEIEIARNMLTTLPEGWEVDQIEPKQPGPQYEMFQRQALTSFSRCTNMPYALAAGTGRDSNFSSFKGDMRNVWEPEVRVEQDEIECTIVEPIFQWFLESAVYVSGLLDGAPAISDLKHVFHWPPLPELDPIDSANAAATRLATGQSSPTNEHARRGQDWDTEASRAAEDFGVSVDAYKQAVFVKTFAVAASQPESPEPVPSDQTPEPVGMGGGL